MRRWPAFSLVEMAVVLMIAGMLLIQIPILMKIYKTHQTKQQIDLAIKSLGAYVAQNLPLPKPESPRTDEEFILRGTLPYKKLGITRKGSAIQYAVDRALTEDSSRLHAHFCKMNLENRFNTDVSVTNDLIAFELSADKIKIAMTRNNFAAQYCGLVCQMPKPEEPTKVSASTKESTKNTTPPPSEPTLTSGEDSGPDIV